MDAAVINENALHLEVGCFAGGLVVVLDECVLQAITRLGIANDFAAQDFAKAAKDEFQVLVTSDWVQFADE